MSIALLLHVLAAVIWVGGMFFAYMVLRPVAARQLQTAERLTLWVGVFNQFFHWVFLSVGLLLATGLSMLSYEFGGFWSASIDLQLMLGMGILMMLIFFYGYLVPFQRLRRAVSAQDWSAGNRYLAQMRVLVGLNLTLGLLTVAIATGGRYLPA